MSPVAEILGAAAVRFAVTLAARRFRDYRKRRQLKRAYLPAAEATITHCETVGHPPRSPVWNAVSSLLGTVDNAETIASWYANHAINPREAATLTASDPNVAQLLQYFLVLLNQQRHKLLSLDHQILADLITTRTGAQITESTSTILDAIRGHDPAAQAVPRVDLLPVDDYYTVERPELTAIKEALATHRIAKIAGPPGVGKSTVAVHVARSDYSGRTLYLSLDSGTSESRQINLAGQLRVDPGESLQSALAHYDGLLFLDNIEERDRPEIERLIPRGGPCVTVLTARDQTLLTSLPGGECSRLGDFTLRQAQDCFRHHLSERYATMQDHVGEIISLLGHLPLAVDVAARTLSARPELSAADWIARYGHDPATIAQDEVPYDATLSDEEIRAHRIVGRIVLIGFDGLPREARLILEALTTFPIDDGGPDLLIALTAAVDPDASRDHLLRLHERGLALRTAPSVIGGHRFRLHRLTRAALQRAMPESDRSSLEERLIAVYVAFAASLAFFDPPSAGHPAAMEERAALQEIAQRLLQAGRPELRTFTAAIAQFALNTNWPADLQRSLLDRQLDLQREASNHLGEANTRRSLGDLALHQQTLPDAHAHHTAALTLYKEIGDRLGEANSRKSLGDLALRQDALPDAHAHYTAALTLYKEIGDRLGEAHTRRSLGELAQRQDALPDAHANYTAALTLYEEVGERLGEAHTLLGLARHDSIAGKVDAAGGSRASLRGLMDVDDALGLRAAWGYFAEHCLRKNQPQAALLACEASLQALPESADSHGYAMSLRMQCDAFAQLQEISAFLATTELIEDRNSLGHRPSVSDLLTNSKLTPDQREEMLELLSQAQQIEGARPRALDKTREALPDFEQRFLAGDLDLPSGD